MRLAGRRGKHWGERLPAALVVFAAAAILAGCGGDDNGAESDASLTREEFIAQADAICTEGNEQIEDGAKAFAKENDIDTRTPSKKETEELVVTVVVPSLEAQAKGLSGLGAPSGEEDEVAAVVSALEAGARGLEEDPASVSESGGGPLSRANELAADFGFRECGR